MRRSNTVMFFSLMAFASLWFLAQTAFGEPSLPPTTDSSPSPAEKSNSASTPKTTSTPAGTLEAPGAKPDDAAGKTLQPAVKSPQKTSVKRKATPIETPKTNRAEVPSAPKKISLSNVKKGTGEATTSWTASEAS